MLASPQWQKQAWDKSSHFASTPVRPSHASEATVMMHFECNSASAHFVRNGIGGKRAQGESTHTST